MNAYVYILRCADGSYYVGSTRTSLEERLAQHNAGSFGGYTARRRPVELVFQQDFDRITDAIAAERQLKGWTRAKKEALIRGIWRRCIDWRRGRGEDCSLTTSPSTSLRFAQDEVKGCVVFFDG
jgi:putative endonuclease